MLHNRYRLTGGEERALALHVRAMVRAGFECAVIERDSGAASAWRAAATLVRGGEHEERIAAAVRDLPADVVHCHNMLPLLGPRALSAAAAAGARVVLHLHNYRLFCSVYAGFRNGHVCFRCRGRNTLPGLVLNCRGSLREAAPYTYALARHQPRVFDAVDRFVAPSAAARDRLVWLGVPAARISVLGHFLPDEAFAIESRAAEGRYALAAGRVSVEKGYELAVDASAASGVPLRIAGDGPAMGALRQRVLRTGAPVELLGRVSEEEMAGLVRGAAMVVVPSLLEETFGLVALEALGAGVPVAAFGIGALPEVAGEASCVPPGDIAALAGRMARLWRDGDLRRAEGDEGIARARERFSEAHFVKGLLQLYAAA